MNIKLHTPTTLKNGSRMSSLKQFLLSLVATSISIVLTFGTAAIIDYQKKKASKKEMVMMIISDFDKTIGFMQRADTLLHNCSSAQQDIAVHPEHYDSLKQVFFPALVLMNEDFPETTENIFSTSIETFNTIGDVNFINEVSAFYLLRNKYKTGVQKSFLAEIQETGAMTSLEGLFSLDFPQYAYINWSSLDEMQSRRDRCMQMMGVSEEDMKSFTERLVREKVSPEREALGNKMREEWENAEAVIMQAQEKYNK